LITDGIVVPNSCGFSGRWSDWVLLIGCAAGWSDCWAAAPLASPSRTAALAQSAREEFSRKARATILKIPLICSLLWWLPFIQAR
jgi:hypothetical protein